MPKQSKPVVVRECVSADAVLPPSQPNSLTASQPSSSPSSSVPVLAFDGIGRTELGENMDTATAAQIVTAQYRRAVSGALEMVRFGATLMQVEVVLTRENNSPSRGPTAKGQGLQAWLETNCPDVNYKTAMRFKTLAEGVRRNCNIPAKVPLALALPASDGTPALPEKSPVPMAKLKKIQQAVWDLVEGKSARQLMFDFAAEGGAAKGGDRRSGKTLTEEEKHAAMVKAANTVWNTNVDELVDNARTLRSQLLLSGDTVAKLLVKLGIVTDALKEAQAANKETP